MRSGVAIGIDGGASSLKWSVRDQAGRLHHGKSMGGNQQTLTWETYTVRLTGAITDALAAAGAAPEAVTAIGMGLSGVDRLPEQQRLAAWIQSQYPALRGCWVGNDALPALRQGAGRLSGIILIAGTGSICIGVAGDGRTIRAGGWGGLLGDEGSGYWIGRSALGVATQMADGRRRPTALLDEILRVLRLNEPMELIPWVSEQDADSYKRNVAALAPVVIGLARQSDPAALRLMRQAQAHLKSHLLAIAGRLDALEEKAEPRTVVCSGGLFEQSDDMIQALAPAMARREPPLTLVRLSDPASLGALHLGVEHPLEDLPLHVG